MCLKLSRAANSAAASRSSPCVRTYASAWRASAPARARGARLEDGRDGVDEDAEQEAVVLKVDMVHDQQPCARVRKSENVRSLPLPPPCPAAAMPGLAKAKKNTVVARLARAAHRTHDWHGCSGSWRRRSPAALPSALFMSHVEWQNRRSAEYST
jgi:hypothetical protein